MTVVCECAFTWVFLTSEESVGQRVEAVHVLAQKWNTSSRSVSVLFYLGCVNCVEIFLILLNGDGVLWL